jgi:hypothetical protein
LLFALLELLSERLDFFLLLQELSLESNDLSLQKEKLLIFCLSPTGAICWSSVAAVQHLAHRVREGALLGRLVGQLDDLLRYLVSKRLPRHPGKMHDPV